ncbi:MAG: hypothetical protein M3R36_11845 [Bacteroidota bacterium]|nr:hypothetical protein [Bacteroidota bacterium]
MNNKKLLSGLLIFLCIFSSSLKAQFIQELSFYAPLPSIFEMKYINNHLLISQQGMRIMDVSNPSNPQLVAQVSYPGNFAYQIATEGNRAYMAKGGGGHFAVYTISNLNSPFFEGSVQIPSTEFLLSGDLVPFGNYVYMAGHDSLYVLNVSNVTFPALVNTIQVPAGEAGEMDINDNTLYITGPTSIRIFDLSNPAAPAFITQIPHMHARHQDIIIDKANDRIFSTWTSVLRDFVGYDAYNISNNSFPLYLFSDSINFSSGDFGITNYYNNILYISRGGGINVFDVSSQGHRFVTSFSGQNVANASVSIEVKDSVFYNARRSGIEVLKYTGPFPNDGLSLSLKALIQGFYNPVSNKMVKDTARIYLRSTSSPYSVVDSARAVLDSNGMGNFTFFNVFNAVPYYIVIRHRNGLETWSATGNSFTSGNLNYDFTLSSSQAFGNNQILKGTKYCIYNGDVNQDGAVDLSDAGVIDNDVFNFISGYVSSDVNGDSIIDLSDLEIADNNILNFVSIVRP